MKANEAPEKLYFGESDKGILEIYSTKESDNEVEYTRTDAFIEKAFEFFGEHLWEYIDVKKTLIVILSLILMAINLKRTSKTI